MPGAKLLVLVNKMVGFPQMDTHVLLSVPSNNINVIRLHQLGRFLDYIVNDLSVTKVLEQNHPGNRGTSLLSSS